MEAQARVSAGLPAVVMNIYSARDETPIRKLRARALAKPAALDRQSVLSHADTHCSAHTHTYCCQLGFLVKFLYYPLEWRGIDRSLSLPRAAAVCQAERVGAAKDDWPNWASR